LDGGIAGLLVQPDGSHHSLYWGQKFKAKWVEEKQNLVSLKLLMKKLEI
jgi:hypothetical protein